MNLGKVKTETVSSVDNYGIFNSAYVKTDHLYQHQFSFGVRYTF